MDDSFRQKLSNTSAIGLRKQWAQSHAELIRETWTRVAILKRRASEGSKGHAELKLLKEMLVTHERKPKAAGEPEPQVLQITTTAQFAMPAATPTKRLCIKIDIDSSPEPTCTPGAKAAGPDAKAAGPPLLTPPPPPKGGSSFLRSQDKPHKPPLPCVVEPPGAAALLASLPQTSPPRPAMQGVKVVKASMTDAKAKAAKAKQGAKATASAKPPAKANPAAGAPANAQQAAKATAEAKKKPAANIPPLKRKPEGYVGCEVIYADLIGQLPAKLQPKPAASNGRFSYTRGKYVQDVVKLIFIMISLSVQPVCVSLL